MIDALSEPGDILNGPSGNKVYPNLIHESMRRSRRMSSMNQF